MTTTTTTTAKISICQCQKIMENNNHHHHYNHGLLCHLIDNSNDNDHQQNPDNSTILYNTSIQSIFGSRYFQKQQQRQRQQQLFILPSSSSTATSISDHCFRFLSTTIIYFHHSLFIDLNISDQKRRKSFIHQPLLRQIQRKMWIRQQYLLLLSSLFLSVFCFGFVFSSITSPSSFTFSSIQNSNQSDNLSYSLPMNQSSSSSTTATTTTTISTTTVISNDNLFNSSKYLINKENFDWSSSPSSNHDHHHHLLIKTSKRSNPIDDFINIDEDDNDNTDDDNDDDDIMFIIDDSDVDAVPDTIDDPPPPNQPIRRQKKSSSPSPSSSSSEEEDFNISGKQQQQQHSFVNDNVDYVMHSPRTVQTKYGALQGIVITFVRYNDDDDDKSSTSTSTSSNQNHNNSSSTSSIPPPPPQPIITLSPVEAFLGVPYATPPSGNLRFMPPVAPIHWRGVRQANHLSPVCPQLLPSFTTMMNLSTTTNDHQKQLHLSPKHFDRLQRQIPFLRNQSEDCLYLNIYVPFEHYYQHRLYQRQRQQQQNRKLKSTTSPTSSFESNTHHHHHNNNQYLKNHQTNGKNQQQQQQQQQHYPVIVFISGDSYQTGTGNSFDASIWSSYGRVIVVTLNYRLGVLGFLPALVDGTIRGNYGLMDQVAALHWIQENIAEFGGEPRNVTLIGHDFGAACVHLLMLSPMAKGLFARVALLSGSALAPSAIVRDAENNARQLAKQLNCPVYDNTQLVDCLKRKPFDELIQAMNHIHISRYLSPFGPIIDGIVVVEEPRTMMESMVYGPLSSAASSSSSSFVSSSKITSSSSSSSSSSPSSSNYVFFKNSASSSVSSDLFAANHYHGDILFGVTKVQCPLDVFTGYEERYGINVERRNQIVRTLIRNLFDFHQQTIFWTLINEYTDWSRPSEHPINLLDSTIDILGHALILAPLIETVELYAKSMADRFPFNTNSNNNNNKDNTFDFAYHSHDHYQQQQQKQDSKSGKIFFYVFQNNPKSILLDSSTSLPNFGSIDSNISPMMMMMTTSGQIQSIDQRLGSMLNDELDYLFGAPIAQHVTGHSIGHFQTNWTTMTAGHRQQQQQQQDLIFDSLIANDKHQASTKSKIATAVVAAEHIHLSQMMITYFSNFAKYGNPNHPTGYSNDNNNNNNGNNGNYDKKNYPYSHNHHHHHNMDDSASSSSIRNENNEFRTSLPSPQTPSSSSSYLLNWPQYTVGQQRFLLIGSKPRLRDHYQSHRLSYWLNLIPHLLQDQYRYSMNSRKQYASISNNIDHLEFGSSSSSSSSSDDIGLRYIRHHLLDNFDDENSYDGPVRQITLVHGQQLNSVVGNDGGGGNVQSIMKKFPGNSWLRSSSSSSSSSGSLFRMNSDQSLNDSSMNDFTFSIGEQFRIKSASGQQQQQQQQQQQNIGDDNTTATSKRHSSSTGDSNNDSNNNNNNGGSSHNLLQATIAVGCSLLALNLLVFAGVYYNLQRQNSVSISSSSTTTDSIVDSTSCSTKFNATKMDDHLMMIGGGQQSIITNNNHNSCAPSTSASATCFANPMGILCTNNSDYYGVNNVNENLIDSNLADGQQQHHHIIHHVHYADHEMSADLQQQQQQQSCHQGMETSSDILNCSLLNDHHGSLCQSPTTNQHQHQHHHHHHHEPEHSHIAQYFPLHSFSSSSGSVGGGGGGGGSGTATSSNPSNTTETDTDNPSFSTSSTTKQNIILSNRTIRFNLSEPTTTTSSFNLDDHDDCHHNRQLSPTTTTTIVPSTSSTNNEILKRVKI
ncbi:uncharacterized protein LOC124495766 isoform X2 [Dermatophagoides farinae]|uniref:uncharacterized protein LOC124495766 isoform X2 n=1 Tax=Dermatophagoides farinae TaxID=6954 RepID=UPI003F61A533